MATGGGTGSFTFALDLPIVRAGATAVLLHDGTVLIVGRTGYGGPTEIFRYDPTGFGSMTTIGSLDAGEDDGTVTLLPSGKVFVTQGCCTPGTATETIDPTATPPTVTPTANLVTPRYVDTATLLADGRVLVVGGDNTGFAVSASAEIFNPSAAGGFGLSTQIASPGTKRWWGNAVRLQNDNVLIVAGATGSLQFIPQAQLFKPSLNGFVNTGSLHDSRIWATATMLTDGRVLVAGGRGPLGQLQTAEIYDPDAGIFASTGSMAMTRESASAVRLTDGRVLIAGGYAYDAGQLDSAEIFDPAANGGIGAFSPAPAMNVARSKAAAVLLNSGAVLFCGGETSQPPYQLTSCELFQ